MKDLHDKWVVVYYFTNNDEVFWCSNPMSKASAKAEAENSYLTRSNVVYCKLHSADSVLDILKTREDLNNTPNKAFNEADKILRGV